MSDVIDVSDEATETKKTNWKRIVLLTGLALVGLFVAMQLVPYGWKHSNPAVTADAPWPDAATAKLAREACYDCHSNETKWPAWSYVAPVSWLVRQHVDEGRRILNFSEWGRRNNLHDAVEVIQEGSMPPAYYTALHPSARLSSAEKQQLIEALKQMRQ